MTATIETHEFQTEAKQLLDLMVHSVYSHKEIFLRELISNASDALDKLRFEALTSEKLGNLTEDAHIHIEVDADKRTLSVGDNGIGMNHDEIIRFIGTIAKSGTADFLELVKQTKKGDVPTELIGQFGVGFYSSFMVADRVTLVTRRAGEEQAWKWESHGDGRYTMEETERPAQGTTVTLHLKPVSEEEGIEDFTQEWVIRQTVKKYSDFVSYPIRMQVERTEVERDEEGKPKEGAEERTVVEDQTLNSMKAIWTRPESEVKEEEFKEFYKHISHDWTDPLKWVSMKAEGTHEFRALLYIPSQAPVNILMPDGDHGIQLYIKRVFIMHDCKELIPEYFRFVRGVVDSEDLSLNISREILQQNRQIRLIRNSLVRKVLDTLRRMQADEAESFEKFWRQFGRVIKEGIIHDERNREALLDLCLFESTQADGGLCALKDYVGRMKDGQDAVYYMTGQSREAIENSPHLEAFRDKGYEVLLLSDPIDEIWTGGVFEHKDKRFKSVGKGEIELGGEEEKKKAEEERKEQEQTYQSLLEAIKGKLEKHVKEVRLSSRLTTSPACLVGEQADLTPQLEQILKSMGQDVPEVKRILELNPNHPIVEKLSTLFEKDPQDPRLAEYAELLYGQAVLSEDGKLADPSAFSRRIAELMVKALD